MEIILIVFLVIAIGVIVLYKSNIEKMTNKDLLSTLDRFSKEGTKPSPKEDNEEPIYGPKAPKIEEPAPTSSSKNNEDGTNVYPDIYGPEITPIPGLVKKKPIKGKQSSDVVDEPTYEFNPDFRNAFPTDENEPQPFLTDFSKFQH